MHKRGEKALKGLLLFGGCYFIFDGLLHLLGIKLSSVNNWPESARSYANLINILYASFIILAGGFIFIIQKDPQKYKSLVILSGVWAFFHGLTLLLLVWSNNYQQIFQNYPSLLVWLPMYREYLSLNSILLFIYSACVYFWLASLRRRSGRKNG